ncbi:MAG: hypothetical protein GSR73_04590 [Desulfurococcales archaeon]|nr:hypothetical protein [Desulfurococcales archaeon]
MDIGNPILAFIALVTSLYAVIVAHDAAQYFSEYDRHTYGVALTIVKIVIGGLGLALLAFISMIVSPRGFSGALLARFHGPYSDRGLGAGLFHIPSRWDPREGIPGAAAEPVYNSGYSPGYSDYSLVYSV